MTVDVNTQTKTIIFWHEHAAIWIFCVANKTGLIQLSHFVYTTPEQKHVT